MKAQIIPGEERSCGDWEREWATELLLSSSVPMCYGVYFLNLINSPSLPHTTHCSGSKSKMGRTCVAAKVGSWLWLWEILHLFLPYANKLSPVSRLLKRQVVHCHWQTCSYHLIFFLSQKGGNQFHIYSNTNIYLKYVTHKAALLPVIVHSHRLSQFLQESQKIIVNSDLHLSVSPHICNGIPWDERHLKWHIDTLTHEHTDNKLSVSN